MAATLAGVCQVPLTSVLLLFELTQDYRIVLPLLGAVGLSSWISSRQTRKKARKDKSDSPNAEALKSQQPKPEQEKDDVAELCKLESSLCVYDDGEVGYSNLAESLTVAQAMKIKYVSVTMETPVVEAVTLMLAEKQSFVMITDNNNFLRGLLTLEDIEDFGRIAVTEFAIPTVGVRFRFSL